MNSNANCKQKLARRINHRAKRSPFSRSCQTIKNIELHYSRYFSLRYLYKRINSNFFFCVQFPLNVCAQKRALFFSFFLVSTIVDLCLNVMQVSQCKMLDSILVLSTSNALAYFTFCYCYFYFCYPVMYRRSEKNREKKNAQNFSHVFVICFTTIQRANEGFGISVTLNQIGKRYTTTIGM